ncbi:MAG: hypothetical protein OEM97_03130 [Acidimicrobiia bacterium]|nr:hypothetical protein [Acidimicrobiia bacterium]
MLIQSVDGVEYVPCIESIETGWEFNHVEFRSGRATFTLDSDRMGAPFLEVALEPTCDFQQASPVDGDEEVERYTDVIADTRVEIVVVPEGRSLQTRVGANDVASSLQDLRFTDRNADIRIDGADTPTAERINQALRLGAHVVIVSVRDVEEDTVTLRLAESDEERAGISLDDAVDEIGDVVRSPSYRGNWYYPFTNGCVTYTFTASGPGVETIEADVQRSLGFLPAEPIRQAGRDEGFVLP